MVHLDAYGKADQKVFGGYSISTTAGDYALFAQMLLNKGQLNGVRILSPKTVELMATNHLPPAAMASGGVGPGSGRPTRSGGVPRTPPSYDRRGRVR